MDPTITYIKDRPLIMIYAPLKVDRLNNKNL